MKPVVLARKQTRLMMKISEVCDEHNDCAEHDERRKRC